jgi:hypothetical protein
MDDEKYRTRTDHESAPSDRASNLVGFPRRADDFPVQYSNSARQSRVPILLEQH